MENHSPQSDSLTPLSQPLVISQDQMRLTNCWRQQKPRKKRKLNKSAFEQTNLEIAKSGELQCLQIGTGQVAREPMRKEHSGGNSKFPLAFEGLQDEASAACVLLDSDQLWEAELLEMDLDKTFYSKQGRPWKSVPKTATWHTSKDLEGLCKKELDEKFGQNAHGWVHHSVDLEKGGTKMTVHQEDCIRVGAGSVNHDTAVVYVDAILSVEVTRARSRGASASEGSHACTGDRAFFIKGWRLITMEETVLTPPEGPPSVPTESRSRWPPQELYLAIHSLSLWPVELVVGKVQVHWGIQAPQPVGKGLLLGSAEPRGHAGQAAATSDEVYCPMKYCSKTRDFVGLDRALEPPGVASITLAAQPPAEIQAQEAQTPQRPALPPPPSSPCRVAKTSPLLQQTRSDSGTNASQPWEPLRLTYDVQTSSQGPSGSDFLQAPSPIVLINASALSPDKKPPPLPFALRCQALSVESLPLQSHASLTCAPASAQPPNASTSDPPQLLAAPIQSSSHPPQEASKLLECAPGIQLPLREQTSSGRGGILQLEGPLPINEGAKRVLRALDLCAGTGAFSLGCSYASLGEIGEHKIEPRFVVDVAKDQLSTCEQNIPGIRAFRKGLDEFYDEIVSSKDPALPGPHNVDLITVGLPCQTFSGANPRNNNTSLQKSGSGGIQSAARDVGEVLKQKSPEDLDKKLPEGRLIFKDFLRIVEYVRPRFILLEEVVEILTLLDERLHEPVAIAVTRDLVPLGYQTRWQVLLASHFGAPQNCCRAFLCAARLGEKLPQVATPTHRGPLGRPSKRLGCFEECLLLLEETPSAAQSPSCAKKQKAKRVVQKKKKPPLGLRIEIRTKGETGETAVLRSEDPANSEPLAGADPQIRQAARSDDSQLQLVNEREERLAPECVRLEDAIKEGGFVAGQDRASEAAQAEQSPIVQQNPPNMAGNALAALMKPSGALKQKLAEAVPVAPDPAAFFRTKEGYALVNKRRPDLAGQEGDRRRQECPCCLQRQRANQTKELLPPVTVNQTIGHLPELATDSKQRRADGSILYNHVVHGVKPGRSKRYAQYQLLKPGQRDEHLPPGLRSHGGSGKQPSKAKGGVKERMPRDGQANTVVCTVNMTNTKCYHYVHNRLTSPREQALIQTFPESYRLRAGGPLSKQIDSWYEEVGNAVPMVVAAALGRAVLSSLS